MPPKTIIVTGASRGIGLAIAEWFLSQKCHQLVVTARSPGPLQRLQRLAPELVEIVQIDMGDMNAGKVVVETALKRFGKIDGLVINHSILYPVKKVANSRVEDWRVAFDINFFSAIDMIQISLPSLRATKGKIIITSSGAAVTSYSGWGAYGASKAALNHMVTTLGVEEPDVTSIAIRPGMVDTEMQRAIREVHHKQMSVTDHKKFTDAFASEKLLRPEQPGHVIAKLALEAHHDLSGRFLTWNDSLLSAFQTN